MKAGKFASALPDLRPHAPAVLDRPRLKKRIERGGTARGPFRAQNGPFYRPEYRRAATPSGDCAHRHRRPGSPAACPLGDRPSRASAGVAGRRIPRSPGPTPTETGRPPHCRYPIDGGDSEFTRVMPWGRQLALAPPQRCWSVLETSVLTAIQRLDIRHGVLGVSLPGNRTKRQAVDWVLRNERFVAWCSA
jgi:hypothetical protein